MYDIVTLGEILIDFSPDGTDDRGYKRYIQNPGGAVANVAAVFAKYGAKAGMIGKVGEDLFGRYLYDYFTNLGVDCGGLFFDETHNTTLAFVSLNEKGDRDFAFYRRNEADLRLTAEETMEKREMLTKTKIFHFGSLSMTAEPARTATREAAALAKQAGALISYDPNYRESLWAGQDAVQSMKSALPLADFVKVSEEEGAMITGETDPASCARALMAYGPRFAAVTKGPRGAYVASPFGGCDVEPYNDGIVTIDTTGAGDVFWGSFLYQYTCSPFDSLEMVRRAAEWATKAAALCTTKKGGASSIPDLAQI